MIRLIIAVALGILFAAFSTQNTGLVRLYALDYASPDIPVYIVVLASIAAGLLIAWISTIFTSISTGLRFRTKTNKLKDYEKQIAELTKELHKLELENTRLKAENGDEAEEVSDSL